MTRRRILFVAEAVTLAQVVRLVELARSLDPRAYEVHFAAASFSPLVFGDQQGWTLHKLGTVDPQAVERALQQGRRLYELSTLERYVCSDLSVIEAARPDVIIGDFRLSLTVSAPLAGVPHVALINAYWSPYATRVAWPLPDNPIVDLLGQDVASRYFPIFFPYVMRHFAAPINRLRRRHGLSEIGSLPEILTHADHVIFPDVPELLPTRGAPNHHHFIGPLLWSPGGQLPADWLAVDAPRVYVTLGSSGRVDCLPTVLEGLSTLPVRVLVATAGRTELNNLPPNVSVAPFVPGDRAARAAALVISNGGSTTGYQALAEGTPVLGVAFNLDQYLAMDAIEKAGAGLTLRSGSLTPDKIRHAAMRVLCDGNYQQQAQRLAHSFARYDAKAAFARVLDSALTSSRLAA